MPRDVQQYQIKKEVRKQIEDSEVRLRLEQNKELKCIDFTDLSQEKILVQGTKEMQGALRKQFDQDIVITNLFLDLRTDEITQLVHEINQMKINISRKMQLIQLKQKMMMTRKRRRRQRLSRIE